MKGTEEVGVATQRRIANEVRWIGVNSEPKGSDEIHPGMLETWLKRQGRGRHDLDALSVLSFVAMGHRALGAGASGVRFARWVVGAILAVRLLANLEQGGWFRRKADRHPRRQGNENGCR